MATMDGLEHPSVSKLSSLGTTGKHTNHIDRDLRLYMQTYLNPVKMPVPDEVSIPLKVLKGKDVGI